MHLREAKPTDFYDLGDIQAKCNTTDTLTRYFIKDMDRYSTTYLRGSIRFCKRRNAIPGTITFVVETDPSDYPANTRHRSPEIIGFTIWTRIGTSSRAREWQARNSSWWKSINDFLDGLEDRYIRLFPSVDGTFRGDLFRRILPALDVPFDADVFAEAWELRLFFVRPDWQRKGVGRMLIQWGLDQATREKVPVVVKSSSLGVAAYRAYGFESLGEIGLSDVLDTLEFGGEEPQLMCWEPEGYKGIWFDRGKRALEKLKTEG